MHTHTLNFQSRECTLFLFVHLVQFLLDGQYSEKSDEVWGSGQHVLKLCEAEVVGVYCVCLFEDVLHYRLQLTLIQVLSYNQC